MVIICLPKQKAQQTQSKINTYTYHSQSVEGQRQTEDFEISRGKTIANAQGSINMINGWLTTWKMIIRGQWSDIYKVLRKP